MLDFLDKMFCFLFGWLYDDSQPCRISSDNAIQKMKTSDEWQYGGLIKKTKKHKHTHKNRKNNQKKLYSDCHFMEDLKF